MKALVVTSNYELELREISPPTPGPYEALVRILACGICSTTDSELVRGTQPYHTDYPCLLGHEAVGEIIEVGPGVTSFKIGDWVTRPAGIYPGTSRDGLSSAWGGFAEFGLVRDQPAMAAAGDHSMDDDYTALRQNVISRHTGIKAAVLSIALAETLSWSRHIRMNDLKVCIAGTGIAGLTLTLWAKLAGARRVIVLGRRPERLELARELGADDVINVRENAPAPAVQTLTVGGTDLFIEASGAPEQLAVATRAIRSGGTIAVYGVAPDGRYNLDWRWLPPQITILQPPAEEHRARSEVLQLIERGKVPVEKLMTHEWPLSRFREAFAAVQIGGTVKSMLLLA